MVHKPSYEELEKKIKELESAIVEYEQTEKALALSENFFRACFENATISITIHDARTKERIIFNREAYESLGYTYEEYANLNPGDIIAQECSSEYLLSQLENTYTKGSEVISFSFKRKNGEIRDYQVERMIFQVDKRDFILSIRFDVTDLNKTQNALKESEEKYRAFFEHAGFPIDLLDAETGECVEFNRAAHECLGYTRDEFQNIKPVDIEQKENPNEMSEHFKKILKNGSDTFETRHIRKDGEIREKLTSAVGLQIGGKSFIHNISADITDRKSTEEALIESEERYRSLVDNIDLGVTLIDPSFNIVMVNQSQIRGFNKSAEQMIGKKCFQEFRGVDIPCDGCPGTEVMTSGKPQETEREHVEDDGSQHSVNIKAFPVMGADKSATGFIEVIEDITEKKRLETQLHRAQRMESLGTLSGGIAHDFNNLLMGIQGRTSLMLSDTNHSHPFMEHLKGIESYIKSAADLTRQLLGFARGGKYEVITTDLTDLIKNQIQMFGRTTKDITINDKYEKNLWAVDVDLSQIEQAILNLFVNAWQAMPGGGHIYIQAENMILDRDYVKPYEIKYGKFVKISITDTGTGMDEATRQRIFEPFFTTKEMGRGTGLGLASVYGVIKNHGGFINVYSEKGSGTTFNIYLPASEDDAEKKTEPDEKLLMGHETVLLVDDEEIIIDVASQILKTLGYTVKTASNGAEAINCYKEDKEDIALVILDMIMPEMNGGKTYDELKKFNPDIKVLLSSGYSINGQAAKIIERGCNGFIQKPFNMNNLSIKLREILDADN